MTPTAVASSNNGGSESTMRWPDAYGHAVEEQSSLLMLGLPQAQMLWQRGQQREAVLDTPVASLLRQGLSQAWAHTDITAEPEEALTVLWLAGIVLPALADVRTYLVDHPDMADTVLVVCQASRQLFGARAQLSLELYRDPEIDDQYLTLYVRQRAYQADLLAIIDDLRASLRWALSGTAGWLLITTDFQPPI